MKVRCLYLWGDCGYVSRTRGVAMPAAETGPVYGVQPPDAGVRDGTGPDAPD